jgi:hypothetical protein
MDNVTYFIDQLDGTEFAIIDHGNGEFTSMLKTEYERRQAEQSTPIVIDETKTK